MHLIIKKFIATNSALCLAHGKYPVRWISDQLGHESLRVMVVPTMDTLM